MKLLHTISLRLLALTTVVLAFWSLFFYFEMMNEINDEAAETGTASDETAAEEEH